MHVRLFYLCVSFILCLTIISNVNSQQLQVENTTMTLIAGSVNAAGSFRGDTGPAVEARLNIPQDVIYHPNGFILIADMSNNRIRKVDLTTGIITTFAGNGSNTPSGNLGLATEAGLPAPKALTIDVFGRVYVASQNQIRVIFDGIIDVFANATNEKGDTDSRTALNSRIGTVGGMALDIDGGLIFCDTENNKVKKVTTNNTVITIAGNGSTSGPTGIGDNGPPSNASLSGPVDVEVDPRGTYYIAERFGNRIRRVRGGVITTIYSRANETGFVPRGLSLFNDIFLYFSNDLNKIQRINLITNTIELVAGTGVPGNSNDGVPGYEARINLPLGMDNDPDGNLYFVEQGNNTVRLVTIPGGNVEPTPRPTSTPTPSPTVTPTPSRTPTSTPRIIQPTATPTPNLTATPTATQGALPRGQLAPVLSSQPSNDTNFLFHKSTTEIIVPEEITSNKVRVVLSSTVDGKGSFTTSDKISLFVTRPDNTTQPLDIVFSDSTPKAPMDITTLFKKGTNRIDVRLLDTKGAGNSSSPLFAVVYSAPIIRDIPDIRGLVGKRLVNVYRINDFISDRDTPIADATVTITSSNPRLVIDSSGPGRAITIESVARPGNATFNVVVDDGIFRASEVINVKHSTFMFNRFQMNPAPLLEDFAYISSTKFETLVNPPDYNLSNVPFETKFATGTGIKAAHIAHGQPFIFPEFTADNLKRPVKIPADISLIGQRITDPNENLDDYDGMIITTSSVFTPGGGRADRNFNFSTATSFSQTNWHVQSGNSGVPIGNAAIGNIPQDPVAEITDGYGAILEVDPGETVILRSDFISLPPGPAMISLWFAVENIGIDDSDVPKITLALIEDSNNYSYSTIQKTEIRGKSQYQFLSTFYDVIDSDVNAAIFLEGVQQTGTVQMYIDNIRVFPMKRDIDRSLGLTSIPVDFDGSFESVLRGLGDFINISFTTGAQAYITQDVNRTITPTGLRKSMLLDLIAPDSGVQVIAGPTFIDSNIYSFPRNVSARAYVNRTSTGNEDGVFGIGITNGDHLAVTFRENATISSNRDTWIPVTTTGYFNSPGEPTYIFIQNDSREFGPISGVVPDGASIAVDDISLETVNDSMNFWDQKRLPKIR